MAQQAERKGKRGRQLKQAGLTSLTSNNPERNIVENNTTSAQLVEDGDEVIFEVTGQSTDFMEEGELENEEENDDTEDTEDDEEEVDEEVVLRMSKDGASTNNNARSKSPTPCCSKDEEVLILPRDEEKVCRKRTRECSIL